MPLIGYGGEHPAYVTVPAESPEGRKVIRHQLTGDMEHLVGRYQGKISRNVMDALHNVLDVLDQEGEL